MGIKKRLLALFVLPGLLAFLTGCPENQPNSRPDAKTISAPEDLNKPGCTVGVLPGTSAMTVSEHFFDKAKLQYYNFPMDAYLAVRQKKVDAFVFDRHQMEYAVKVNPDLYLLPDDIAEEHIVVCLPHKHTELLKEVNRFIEQYRRDGTYEDMRKRWFSAKPPPMPEIPLPAHPARRLKVAMEGFSEPMNFYGKNHKLTGFDVEFTRRLALFLNAGVEISTMDFFGLIPAVETGKVDLLISSVNATPERKEKMLMSRDYVDSGICVMIRKDRLPAEKKADGVITSVKDLSGKRAAYLTGSIFAQATGPLVDNVEYLSFNDNNSSVQALRSGKVEAVLLDEPVAKLFAAQFPDELYVACIYAEDSYGFAFRKGSPMTAKATAVIRELKRSGKLDALIAKWCGAGFSRKTLEKWTHRKDFSGKNGTLRFAADPVMEPMCYAGPDGQYIGLDVEIMRRIAYDLDMKFEFVPMNFGSLIEALISGKIDAAGGSMSITKERAEKVDFAESHYLGGMTILARKPGKAPGADAISSVKDLSGKRAAYLTGSCYRQMTEALAKDVKFLSFSDHNSSVQALRSGKADAALINEPMGRLFVARFPAELKIACSFSEDNYGIAFRKGSPLAEKTSAVIRNLKKSGELEKMTAKWCGAGDAGKVIPEWTYKPDFTGRNGILKFAAEPTMEPMCYAGPGGEYLGLDVEIMRRVAYELDMKFEFIPMNFGGLIEALISGKADAAGGAMSITKERAEKVDFAESHYAGAITVLSRKAPDASSGANWASFKQYLKDAGGELAKSFNRTFIREDRWKLILEGLWVTILITILSALLGTVLAFGVCAMRRSRSRFLAGTAKGYVSLMQGTPILVILMILYYVIFAKVDIDAILVAVIGFALNFAAYVSEMFRSGIEGIPKGQSEAALALGFSRFAAFRKVILPQVLRRILPIYRGEFVSMLKMTSIVGYIAIQDLTKMSDIIRSRTYEAFFPLIATAVIYYLAAYFLACGISRLEFRLDPEKRRAKRKGGTAQ